MLHILQPTGLPVGVEPRAWRKAIRERIDQHLASVEALLAALDSMDTDCDLEEGGDLEPSLGWPSGHGLSQLDGTMRHDDDREADNCDDEETGDDEHSLGWGDYWCQRGVGVEGWTMIDHEDA